MKKIAVILSGCGYLDGSEVTETVSLLIALHQAGAETFCFAPNIEVDSVNHQDSTEMTGKRNLLKESARLCRGQIQDLATLQEKDFDALALPGGFGAAKNLSTWASEGAKCKVLPDIQRVILDFYNASKPIGAMCIAPVILAKVLGDKKLTLTIGHDPATISEISKQALFMKSVP